MGLSNLFNSKAFRATAAGLATVMTFVGAAGLANRATDGEILNAFLENRDTITLQQDIKDISTAEAEAKINSALDTIAEHSQTGAALVKMARDDGIQFFGTRQMGKTTMAYYSISRDLVGFNPDTPQSTLIKNLSHELTHFYQDKLNLYEDAIAGRLDMMDAIELSVLVEAHAGAIEQRIKWDLKSAGIEDIWGDTDMASNNFMELAYQKGLAEAINSGHWGEEANDMATKAAFDSFFADEGIMLHYMNDLVDEMMEHLVDGKLSDKAGRRLNHAERMVTVKMPQGHSFSDTAPDAFAGKSLRLEYEFRMLAEELEAQRQGTHTNPSLNRYSGMDVARAVEIYKNADGNVIGGVLGAAQHAVKGTAPTMDAKGYETSSHFEFQTATGYQPTSTGPG